MLLFPFRDQPSIQADPSSGGGSGEGGDQKRLVARAAGATQGKDDKQEAKLKREMKAVYTLLNIVVIFLLCWVPFYILFVVSEREVWEEDNTPFARVNETYKYNRRHSLNLIKKKISSQNRHSFGNLPQCKFFPPKFFFLYFTKIYFFLAVLRASARRGHVTILNFTRESVENFELHNKVHYVALYCI